MNWQRSWVQWRDLTLQLTRRDVLIRYKHSILGIYWAVLNPLLTAMVFTLVFSKIMRIHVHGLPYVVYMLTGLIIWNLFGNSVITAVNSLTGNANLLAKSYFPREILPTSAVAARFVDFVFALLVLVGFYLAYRVRVGWSIFTLPLVLLPEIIFALGTSYLVAALNVFYRDVNQLVGLVLLLWMYLTPIIYSVTMVPAQFHKLYLLDPMAEAVYLSQQILLYNRMPFSWHYAVLWLVSVATFFIGLGLFRRLEPLFGEIM